ncbi:MAG TPA: lipopolysaccharide biosynthesis protein, partial [Coprobacter fastidiosus]|nr:lipopolysaccharide biosynthesis protein [Coprobacter fastidiosus]
MINSKFSYLLRNGKNPKFVYYGVNYLRLIIPKFFFRIRLKKELEKLNKSTDKDYIMQRVNYYNQLDRDSLSL